MVSYIRKEEWYLPLDIDVDAVATSSKGWSIHFPLVPQLDGQPAPVKHNGTIPQRLYSVDTSEFLYQITEPHLPPFGLILGLRPCVALVTLDKGVLQSSHALLPTRNHNGSPKL